MTLQPNFANQFVNQRSSSTELILSPNKYKSRNQIVSVIYLFEMDRNMKCRYCEFSTNFSKSFLRHFKNCHASRKHLEIACGQCSKLCFSIGAYSSHLFRHHSNFQPVTNQLQNQQSLSKFVCKNCSKEFSGLKLIKKHIREELRLKISCQCPHCPLVFSDLTKFNNHYFRCHPKCVIDDEKCPSNNHNDIAVVSGSSTSYDDSSSYMKPIDDQEDLEFDSLQDKFEFANFLLSLKVKYGLSNVAVDYTVTKLTSIIDTIILFVEKKAKAHQLLNESFIEKLRGIFNLSEFATKYKRTQFYKKNLNFVPPEKYSLGYDKDRNEKFLYYVPIKKNLQSFISDKEVQKFLLQPMSHDKNLLKDVNCGLLLKSNNNSLPDFPKIQIILFSDAVNLCSAIGSAHKNHKIEGVYYTIAGIPPHLRYKMDNIQLAFVYNVNLLQTFPLEKIYSFFLNDLKDLESNGIDIQNFKNIEVRLIGCCGDNLGLHQLGGFNQCFSSGNICRWCLCTYQDLQNWDYSIKSLRDPQNYNDSLNSNTNGVRKNSPLNQLHNFHVCAPGLAPDFGHDCFHGAFNVDLVVILNFFSTHYHLKLEGIIVEVKFYAKKMGNLSLPNISKDKINGRMTDVWNLIICLSLAFYKLKFNVALDVYKFFIEMLNITRYLTAEIISFDQVVLFDQSVNNYMRLKKKCFPNSKLLPKHHFMMHYSTLMQQFGPLKKWWTCPWEQKHKFFKYQITRANNFINPELLVSNMHQLSQALLFQDRFPPSLKFDKTFENVDICPFKLHEKFISFAKRMSYNGVEFREKDYVVIGAGCYNELTLLLITKMFISFDGKECLLLGEKCFFEEFQNAGIWVFISKKNSLVTIKIEELLYHKPVKVIVNNHMLLCSLSSSIPVVYLGVSSE